MRTLRPVLRALLAHWRRHPLQIATLLVGLTIATALWSGVQALNAEARASYARAAAVLGGDRFASILPAGGDRITLADYLALRRADWAVSPVLEGEIRQGEARLRIVGIEPLTLPPGGTVVSLDGDRLDGFLSAEGLALAEPATAARLRDTPDLPPLEAVADVPPDTLVMDIAAAARLLGREDPSRLVVPTPPGPLPESLGARLVLRPAEGPGDIERLTDSFHLNLTAFGFLSFVVGLFIVHSAIGLAFEQRRPMLRTLRAIGVSARALTLVLLLELTAIATLAGLAGVAGGYAVAAALLPDVAATLGGLYGARVPGSLTLDPSWWLAGLAMSLLGALLAGGMSLWRAARLPLLATGQPEAWRAAAQRSQRWQLAGALTLGLGAGLGQMLGSGLVAGFALMGGLLLSAALLLPTLVDAGLSFAAARARGAVARWAFADLRQQLPGLSLALMALLIALAVNVGVGTMVDSFRRTFLGWLDQRLTAEVYLTARDPAEAAALAEWLDGHPSVAARLPIWSASTRIADWPTEVYGFKDHPTYRDHWPLIAAEADVWDQVARGEGVLVSEQLARRTGLALGATLPVATARGLWTARVAGIYSDYGNPAGQLMVAIDVLTAHWPEAERLRFALRVAPAAVPSLLSDLDAEFGLADGQVIDQASLKAFSREIFERTFTVTLALNALTLAVAGAALFASLLTLAGMRLVHLAPLWAMGLTRRHLAWLEIGRTLGLAAVTALLALPLGLATAWVLTQVINVEAFGWRLPLFVFPADWLRLFGLALLTALIAGLWPTLRLARTHPLNLLQGFSNER